MGIPLRLDPEKSPSRLYEGIQYKDFWTGLSKDRLDQEEQALVNELLPASGRRFIDVGCGFGRLAGCYLNRFQQVVMLDGSMTLLKQAQEISGEKAFYIAADVNHLPFQSESFDCALMIRVFHHLPNSQAILLELKRILGDSGVLVFNYSNKRNARQIFEWLLRLTKVNPFTLEPAGLGTTFIHHHPQYVNRVLNDTGFSLIKYRGSGVMDKITAKLGLFDKLASTGKFVAPAWGAIKLAPWIICKANSGNASTTASDKGIEELLICPSCHHSLQKTSCKYTCLTCGKQYPIKDGIVDFRFN